MFELSNLKKNKKLIDDCAKLIEKHNQLSYQTVHFIAPSVNFDSIKPKRTSVNDHVSLEIIKFYEIYVSQMLTTTKLESIIDSINYTNEDLSIHIDRSTDSILQIFSSLAEIRYKLIDANQNINNNITLDVSLFVDHVKTLITDKSAIDEILSVIYICMKQDGLSDSKDFTDRYFIYVGTKLIKMMHGKGIFTEKDIRHINDLNDDLKRVVLSANDNIKDVVKINSLQTFGLVPDEGPNVDLPNAMKRLLGISIEVNGSIKKALEPISKSLKLSNSNVSTGLIVILSPNVDSFFDMTNLDLVSQSNQSSGVNEKMIRSFELLQTGSKSNCSVSEVITIGISENTDRAFVLWSNDSMSFKVRSKPIDKSLIQKICRCSPSTLIQSYNSLIESVIADNRKSDAVSFNRVKYMSFNESTTEESFLAKFKSNLSSSIINMVGAMKGSKLHSALIDSKFTKSMLDAMDSSKVDLGIHHQMLSSHCHIIYASMANMILHKIKKQILSRESIDKASLKDIVDSIVDSNDNIYSRVIASYYLHIA